MKTADITPMPRLKLFLYLFLLMVAFLLFGYLLWKGLLTNDRLVAIIVGAMLSLFITTSTDLIPETARRIEERFKRGRFKRFFGEAAIKRTVRLVFAYRTLKEEVLKANLWNTYYKTPANKSAEGVNAWLAFQDIRAATYLKRVQIKVL